MFGLIKQLAKLIVIAKNIPQLLSLLPRMITETKQPGTLDISVDIAKVVSLPQILEASEEIASSSTKLIESENSFYQSTLESITNDTSLSESEKTLATQTENVRHTLKLEQITSNALSDTDKITSGIAADRAIQIDPAIRTTLAPITLMVGIPAGIKWLTNILTSLGNIPVTGADAAEAAFNSDINSAESAEGVDGQYPVGSTVIDKEVLLTFSQIENPAFEYDDNGVAVKRLKFFVKDDVKDNPNYNLTLNQFGVNFPSNQKDRITYFIDNNTGEITVNWRYASIDDNISQPRFDSSITFVVEGDKINRRRARPDGTTRARNTFNIPIKFTSTFPQQ